MAKGINNVKKEFRNKIESIGIDSDIFLIGCGRNGPVFNIGERAGKDIALYAIMVFDEKEVFFVWDLQWRRKKRKNGGPGSSLCLLDKSWNSIPTGQDTFVPFYRHLEEAYGDTYEKVYVVGMAHFYEFFRHYSAFMQFNSADEAFPKVAQADADIVEWHSDEERKRYAYTRPDRDKEFRSKVLEAYKYQCAICRCGIYEILEAAHEHGYEVKDTAYDDPMHGICLCANHHLMYDRELIDIDLEASTIAIRGKVDEIMESVWHREFVEKYHGKIKKRK